MQKNFSTVFPNIQWWTNENLDQYLTFDHIWSHLTACCYTCNAYFMQQSWCRDRKLNFIYFNCKLLQFAPSVLLEIVESYVVWVRYWYKKPFEVKKAILLHGKQGFWIPNVWFRDQSYLHSSIKQGLWICYSMTWYTASKEL